LSSAACSLTGSRFTIFAHGFTALIDLAIAIVIDIVPTDLLSRRNLSLTYLFPFAFNTTLNTGLTSSYAFGLWLSRVTSASLADQTITADLIDQAVAIVIYAVADLWLRHGSRTIKPLPVLASLYAFATSRLADPRQFFIDRAIAIIVYAIADLRLGRNFTHTIAPYTGFTGADTRLTRPDTIS
jgi:hypothetical protein